MNPHGMLIGNLASSGDMLCLMSYAMKFSLIQEVCAKKRHECIVYSFDHIPKKFVWDNTNTLLNEFFVASKTGNTDHAGPCLVSHFKFGPYES